jgi:hypothetical protein
VKPGFPDYEQPVQSWVTWDSPIPWKLDIIKVRTTLTENVPACSLLIASETSSDGWELVQTNAPLRDSEGYYWQFQIDMVPQNRWKLDWGFDTKASATRLTVSGQIYLLARPSTPRARAQLAIYPLQLVPNDESLCRLAIISVDNYKIPYKPDGELFKDDIREIINRDYEPLADWLTQFWDSQLIRLWEDVRAYAPGYMAPPTLLKQSYAGLELYGIDVNPSPPPYTPPPDVPVETLLIGATVSLFPPITSAQFISATVTFSQ